MSIMTARTLRLAAPLSALGLALAVAAPASAATVSPVNTTYDRPGITLVPGGNFEIAWAGTDPSGKINGALVNTNGAIIPGTKWTDNNSATYQGTGAAIAFDPGLDFSLIAWTDLSTTVHVVLDNGGASCDSTGFGSSVDTPYLTIAADGTLYVSTVGGNGVMHVTEVDNNGCVNEGFIGGPGTLAAGPSTTVAGNTSYNGPTLVDLHGSGTPDLWLIWAGANSAHNINIARFTPGNPNLGAKYVETNHATTTDMGSTTFTLDPQGAAFFTYCGTNNVVYGQWFLGTGPETEIALGGSCNIYTNSSGFINGGVDVTYDQATSSFDYLFPDKGNLDLILNAY
jgi:hypothetical protein